MASQRDVPALIRARKAFTIGNVSATSHYPDGVPSTPYKGMNRLMWPQPGALYIIYSYTTPIAWIDQWGRAKRTPQRFSTTTSRHQSLCYYLDDDAKVTGRKRDRDRQDKIDEMRYLDYLREREEARIAGRRRTQQRRYWTPERVAAKEARDRAKDVAELYGVKHKEALKAITRAPDEFTLEEALASLTGGRVTRDAKES
jgi:hypothetical protein